MLPDADRACIDPAKLRDYLLSPIHPVGRFKAVAFMALGYRADRWEELRDDLLALARSGAAVAGQASAFGQKFQVSATLKGPNGREANVTCVWLMPADGSGPRLITAFPG